MTASYRVTYPSNLRSVCKSDTSAFARREVVRHVGSSCARTIWHDDRGSDVGMGSLDIRHGWKQEPGGLETCTIPKKKKKEGYGCVARLIERA